MADLHIHTLTVRNHRITCDSPVLVQHGMGHDAIALDLDAEWDGLSVRPVLGPCGSAYDVLYEGEPVVVPAATLAEAGWLPVSVVGYGDDGAVRVTTERCDHLLRVVESGCTDGSVPPEDAPTIAQDGAVSVERSDGTTSQLGTVQMPQLPAPTFNAYATGGYVPGETDVDYERDVNIAYAELEAKIAALTVAQATS